MRKRSGIWASVGILAILLGAILALPSIGQAGQAMQPGQAGPSPAIEAWGEPNPTILKIGGTSPLQHHYFVGLRIMGAIIEDMTRGRYKFEYYPSSQLGGERDLVEGVKIGTMKLTAVSTGPLSGFNPMMKLVDLPYLFVSAQQAYKVLDGPIGRQILDEFEKSGLHALVWYENGFRQLTNSRRPVKSPADLKGLKIRVMESPVMVDSLNAMGAQAVAMAWPEVFTSLQQGVIDGQENPAINHIANRTVEVTPYVSLTSHFYNPAVVLVNLAWWKGLGDFDRQVYQKAADTSRDYMRMWSNYYNEAALKLAETQYKNKIERNVDIAAFQKAVQPVYDKYLKQIPNGESLVKQIRAMQ
jgi:tripartite ATP-independent transporter DctP family solute receptor